MIYGDVKISIRAPARGATMDYADWTIEYKISIRAPARGATICNAFQKRCGVISIRAPARGATWLTGADMLAFQNFNPRSREGSDRTP